MAYLLLLLDVQFGFDIDKTERIQIAENIFGLRRKESDEVNTIMDAFDYIWHGRFDKGFTKGKTEGIAIGKAEGIAIGKAEGVNEGITKGITIGETETSERDIRNLASYFFKNSGNSLSRKEATEKAEAILSGKDLDN